jgi:long-chain acyl-CoA synthetase
MAENLHFLKQHPSQSCLVSLRHAAEHFPDEAALSHKDQTLSYRQLSAQVAACREKLLAAGLNAGDSLFLLVPNSIELVLLQLAAMEEGLLLALADVRTRPEELSRMCALAKPVAIIAHPRLMEQASRLSESQGSRLLASQDLATGEESRRVDSKSGGRLVYFRQDRNDIWQGAIFRLQDVDHTVQLVRQLFSLHKGSTVLCHMSGAHYLSLPSMILPALCSAGHLVILDRDCPQEEVLDAVAAYNPQLMIHYRQYFWALHKAALKRADAGRSLGVIQHAVVNADSPSLPFRQSWEELFQGHLLAGFATTFAGAFLALDMSWLERREGFVGKALPGAELRIVDESGNDRPNGRWGEILFTSNGRASAFLENSEGNPEIWEEGWLRTQQMAMRNSDSFLTLADEVMDVIWVHGFKVSPLEIEEPMLEQPGILDCAAVNAPRSSRQDQIQLFVVSDTDDNGEAIWNSERLIKVCERIFPPYLRPALFHVIEAIPYDDEEIKLRKELKYRYQSAESWRNS